jgi:hypothetical protein
LTPVVISSVQLIVKLRRRSADLSVMGDERPTRSLIDPVLTGPGSESDRQRIGEIFVELGLVAADELDAALAVQRERGGMLGEILVGQGKVTRLGLAQALAALWEYRESSRPPRDDDPVDVPDVHGLARRAHTIARESQEQVEALAQELRAEAAAQAGEISGQLGAQAEEAAKLRAWVAALHEAVAAVQAKEDQADALLRQDVDSLRAKLEELRTIHTAAAQASRDVQDEAVRAASEAQQFQQRITLETERLSTEVAELRARTELLASSEHELPDRNPTPPAAEAAPATKGKRPKRKRKDRR